MAYNHVRTVVMAALSLLLLTAALAVTRGVPAAFPLTAGTVWTYRGLVKWTAPPNTVRQRTISWTMTITRTLAYRQYVIAVLKGHPADLAWYDEHTQPGDYLIVYDGTAKYYLLQGDSGAQLLARVQGAHDDLADLLTPAELFLALPLTAGKTFATDPQLPPRTDHWYCWAVEAVRQRTLPAVQGIDPALTHTSYRLAYRTGPDETIMDFVPGIGLTTFTYSHHGTIAEAHLQLVAFHTP